MVTVETFKTLQTCEKKTVHKADTFRNRTGIVGLVGLNRSVLEICTKI